MLALLEDTYGRGESARWFMRWHLFFIACAELFGYCNGEEWGVSHYLFEPRGEQRRPQLPNF